MLLSSSCSGIRPDLDPQGEAMLKQMLQFTLNVLSAMKTKVTIKVAISANETIGADAEAKTRFDRITTSLHTMATNITEIIDPETSFAKACAKDTSGTIPFGFYIPLMDGTRLEIEIGTQTIGYTPAARDIHEMVAEGIEPTLDLIGGLMGQDMTTEEIEAWKHHSIEGIHEQLGLPMHTGELVGATIGGSGSEGGGIREHRSDADLGS